jgi:hypothetical protein
MYYGGIPPHLLGFRFKMEDPGFISCDNNRKPSPPIVYVHETFVTTAFLASV